MTTNGSPPLSNSTPATKRAYLALLPPEQIIEICLSFDPYVPQNVKSLLWPVDLNAAIAALQAKSAEPKSTLEQPIMASLLEPSSQPTAQSSTSAVEVEGSTSEKNQAKEQSPPPQQPYANFPYQSAYPHTPYYSPHLPPGYPPYPTFPQGPHAHPPTHPQPNSLSRSTPDSPQLPPDDLPSYEEMIVEALKEFADPEGAAPKDLFTWMASHYPLQTNFRPSASQALQKAFRRGRFEKSTNGRYRLNPSWEGGNTSRRTTRRPQIQAQTVLTPPSTQQAPPPNNVPPFTHTPLHRHPPPPSQSGSTPAQQPPYPYFPYPYPPLGYPGYPPYPPPPPAAWQADEEIGEGSEAWKAAQSILKAITGPTAAGASIGQPSLSGVNTDGGRRPHTAVDGRAELQVHLALLAAQLMGIAQAKEESA